MTTSGNSAKGLEGVVAAETRLSDVQGEAGELIYCGYNIHELAGNVTYEEVVHLLHENRLPNSQELAALKKTLAAERHLPQPIVAGGYVSRCGKTQSIPVNRANPGRDRHVSPAPAGKKRFDFGFVTRRSSQFPLPAGWREAIG
jgi:hypothetical protein